VAVPRQLIGGVNVVASGPPLKNSDTGGGGDDVVHGLDDEDKVDEDSGARERDAVVLPVTGLWATTIAAPVTRNCTKFIAIVCRR
jgi:hypothetical protein